MESHGSNRGLQFVGYCIDEAVMLLASAKLPHQENRIHHHAGNDQREEHDSEEQEDAFAPVQDDPSDVQRDCQCYQTNAQAEEENDSSAAARDAHSGSA